MAKPYEVKRNDKVGRYMVAARGLKAGDEVLVEAPFAVGPKSGSPPLCLGCYVPVDASVVCSVCGWPVCGVQCQELPAHAAAECLVFAAAGVRYQAEPEQQRAYGSPQYECITPLRALLAKERHPERWAADVRDMEAHTDERRLTRDWATEQVNVVDFLRTKCKLADRFDEDVIHFVIGAFEVNAFEVRTDNGFFVRGIYPQTAMMSHNCVANTTHSIYPADGFRSHMRVTVAVNEGEELHVSYTSSIQPTLLRRENVKASKYFDCDCKRCADPTELGTHLSSLKCTNCDKGIIMSTSPLDQGAIWSCSACEFSIKPERLRKILKVIQSEIDQLDYVEDMDAKIEQAETLMRKYKSVLHPRHVLLTSLRHVLVQLYGRAPGYTFPDLPDVLLERKIELCRSILEVADVVKPGMNRFRGMILYELHVPLMLFIRSRFEYNKMSKQEFQKRMEEVATILEEAVKMLCLEDPSSPEGAVGLAGRESLQQLRASIAQL